ncbi:hypothetical protein OG432_02345 [Streptomyces sp. NBC_00442]|uniref:hypothetical protein n=1 Tax=Streptomyces sp. NBC_00442 TaxID=2903651 RepID=UPI002E1B9E09
MKHTLQHAHTPSQDASRVDAESGPRTGGQFGEAYDQHAEPLFALARLLCEDNRKASSAFVTAMACLGAHPHDLADDPRCQRRRLAEELWRAAGCPPQYPDRSVRPAISGPAADQRKGIRSRPSPSVSPESFCSTEQALLGLVLLGGHTYREAADLLDLPPDAAAQQLREALLAEHQCADH